MSLRDATARAAYEAEWEGVFPESGIQCALAYQIADAVLAAQRTELAAHPESAEEIAPEPFKRVTELETALRGVRAHLMELDWRGLTDAQLAVARIDDVLVESAPDQENQ